MREIIDEEYARRLSRQQAERAIVERRAQLRAAAAPLGDDAERILTTPAPFLEGKTLLEAADDEKTLEVALLWISRLVAAARHVG